MDNKKIDITENDENMRRLIVERVLLGIFFIGLIQTVVTIFGHQSNSFTLMFILILVPLVGATYWYVHKTGKTKWVGRFLMYVAIPILIYRAHTMGGVWGVTTNWIYLVPVFGALILEKKEILFLAFLATIMMLVLAWAHSQDPDYALKNLLLVPPFARVLYLLMPMYVISYVIIFYERQRKKFIETIRENARQELQNEKLISIGSMSAGMAHEINNPLMVLQGSINLIDSRVKKLEIGEKDKERFYGPIDNLNKGVKRIAKIIESVKALSSNTDNIDKEKFILEDIIDDALVLYKEKLSAGGIRLLKDENLIDEKVYAVKIQIEQIIMNFISNSIDELAKKENPWIRLITTKEENFVCLRVMDSGLGIDAEVIRQVFDPFFTTKEVGKGTGLGLSLCRSLAQKNGGDIFYELYHGHTSFVLKIPLAH